MTIHDLFDQAVQANASDIHFAPNQPPLLRVAGKLEKTDAEPLTSDAIASLVLPVLPEPVRTAFANGATPWAETIVSPPDSALDFHVMVFRTQGQVGATVRLAMLQLPTLEQIGGDIASLFEKVAQMERALVLITGPHGSGKMTTAGVVLETINQTRNERIFVVEGSPSYRFVDKQSVMTRWQIGQDVESYEAAAQLLWKCDPDVIYFGDLPTPEAVRQALLLADAGHLVIAVLAAESVADAIAGMTASFGSARPALQKLLARTLGAAFNQRLLPRSGRPGRAVVYEVLWATPELREILATGRDEGSELETFMEKNENSRTRAGAIAVLQAGGIISAETAQAALAAS